MKAEMSAAPKRAARRSIAIMVLWTGEALAQAVGGHLQGALPPAISGIAIDSRSLQAGEAFFALTGERLDGHAYVAAAAKAGAALAVVEAAKLGDLPPLPIPLLAVDNSLKALEKMAKAARARLRPGARVAAITGSVGKTTIKEMLAQALAPFGRLHYSPASFNNHFGVPLSLARMPADTDFAIYEIGMNHAGEITPLSRLARPHLALISRIAAAHRGHFNSLDDIAAAKAEIFAGLEPNGAALLNRDDEYYEFLAQKARSAGHFFVCSFGRSEEADYRLVSETETAQGRHCRLKWRDKREVDFTLRAHGAHNALNGCAALAAVSELAIRPKSYAMAKEPRWDAEPEAAALYKKRIDFLWQQAVAALAQFQAGAGRGARYRLALPHKNAAEGEFLLIDESYNANPLSMAAAIKVLGETQPAGSGRRIAVLGDMLELGAETQSAHEALAEKLAEARVDSVFLAGEAMRFLQQALQQRHKAIAVHWRQTAAELVAPLEQALQAGDCVMVKSSNSIGTAKLAAALLAACCPVR